MSTLLGYSATYGDYGDGVCLPEYVCNSKIVTPIEPAQREKFKHRHHHPHCPNHHCHSQLNNIY